MKALNRGNAEMAIAPITQKVAVMGIVLYSPPRSDPLMRPVIWSTEPMVMKRRPLKITSANACATAPLSASAVPSPTPVTMKPI